MKANLEMKAINGLRRKYLNDINKMQKLYIAVNQ